MTGIKLIRENFSSSLCPSYFVWILAYCENAFTLGLKVK